jgi:hypothetical protein
MPLTGRLTDRLVMTPRLLRMLLVGIFALAVTLSLSPLVDLIYSEYFFSMDTVIVPSLVSAGFGLIMYALGWWLLVGTVGERPIARIALLWYCGTGVLALLVVIFLIVRGVTLVNLIAGS